ncbi:MAG: DUF262 domain-containing protein [Candidatus Poribacteria bacterium]|nr:DUF262 domain-containing protein [Candidatus Poribacteria bacterium]
MLKSVDDLTYSPRELSKWMWRLASGQLALPTFQRGYAWNTPKTRELVKSLLQGHPVGSLLLIPDNKARFDSRPLKGVKPTISPDDDVADELVLDGQQRLTALWKAFRSDPAEKDPELFVEVVSWHDDSLKMKEIHTSSGIEAKMPESDRPFALYQKRLFPFKILGIQGVTTHDQAACRSWCIKARKNDADASMELYDRIREDLLIPLHNQKIWYQMLPKNMSWEDAIGIFIKTNQVAAIIKKYDICVAKFDEVNKGISFRNEVSKMIEHNKGLIHWYYGQDDKISDKFGELLVKVACLWASRAPTEGAYLTENVQKILKDRRQEFPDSLAWSLNFYAQEGILGDKFAPSEVPLRVLPALYPVFKNVPEQYEARAFRMIRAYLWSAFLTERYRVDANRRLHKDFEALEEILKNPGKLAFSVAKMSVPIFNKEKYPLPPLKELYDLENPVRPPTQQSMRSRAIFAITMREAKDFATGKQFIRTAGRGQYHHLFPIAYLSKNGLSKKQIDHCLNFALITDTTNRVIGKTEPYKYLAPNSKLSHSQGADELQKLVESHFIPFKALDQKPDNVAETYRAFIEARAKLIYPAMETLIDGGTPSPF